MKTKKKVTKKEIMKDRIERAKRTITPQGDRSPNKKQGVKWVSGEGK